VPERDFSELSAAGRALAEYIACPAHAVAPLPEGTVMRWGRLIEPLGVGLHAVRLERNRGTWNVNVEGEPGLVFLARGRWDVYRFVRAGEGRRQIAVVERWRRGGSAGA